MPADVVGRDDMILELVGLARTGTNFIVSDPRRMGKTAMLLRLCNEPGQDVTALYVNLEGLVTRLDSYYDDPKLATAVLDHLAINAPITFVELCAAFSEHHRESMLRLVDDLVDDHYINHHDHTWRYGALRTVWATRRKLNLP